MKETNIQRKSGRNTMRLASLVKQSRKVRNKKWHPDRNKNELLQFKAHLRKQDKSMESLEELTDRVLFSPHFCYGIAILVGLRLCPITTSHNTLISIRELTPVKNKSLRFNL